MGPEGAYDPSSNLEFAVSNIVDPSGQRILYFSLHPVLRELKSYHNELMNRDHIDLKVLDKKKKNVVGLSASQWTASILETLRCVHTRDCHMKAIIPNFAQRQNKVLSLLQSHKSIYLDIHSRNLWVLTWLSGCTRV
jgi:hypothetical protein